MTAAVLVPLLILLVVELILRAAGYGYPTSFFQKVRIQGEEFLVPNSQFGLRFFPASLARAPAPVPMRVQKKAGTIRIFVFGESAAQGDPRPQFGASRYLQVLLKERFPGQEFEVINTSVTAINSHVILPIARECAQHDGDFWIIYMGNNEMVGPFGAATVFGAKAAPLPAVRFSLAIRRMRTGQLLLDLAGKLRGGLPKMAAWGGMQMFTENEVAPGDIRRARVYGSFERNLEDVLQAGTAKRNPGDTGVILSTMAVNLKDCPPFASVRPGAENAELFEKALRLSASAKETGDYPNAVAAYRKSLELLPDSAEAHFGLATCLLHLTNRTEARQEFELARDCDSLPFRTDSRLNAILTNAAVRFQGRGVVLCDASTVFATNSRAGVPGSEFFFEHVHFNPDGNYRLALTWAGAVEGLLPPALRQRATGEWPGQRRCEQLLGLTDWNRVSILLEVIERMGEPPLSSQSNNSNRVAALRNEIALLRHGMSITSTAEVKNLYLDAVKRSPNDYMLREAYAEFLLGINDRKEEIVQREKIIELTPNHYFGFLNLGMVLRDERRLSEAETALRKAARLNPNQAEVRLQLGAVYGLQNKYEEALREFERARRILPYDPRPLHFAGEALWKANRHQESISKLREAVQVQPGYVDARYRLGEELAQLGEIQDAARELQEVVRLSPQHAKAHFNLGVAFAKMGRLEAALEEFERVLHIDPQNKLAMQLKQQVLNDMGKR